MEDLKKIVKQFQDFGFLVKGFTKIVENRTKEKKGCSLGMPFGTLGADLLINMQLAKELQTQDREGHMQNR